MPALQAIHAPDPTIHVPGQPASFVPIWQGTEPEPPEGANLGDLDLDGLPVWYELWLGTNPGDPDTDDDGATDLEELQHMSTDPRLWDSNGNDVGDLQEWQMRHADGDEDGLSDWDEIQIHGTDPTIFDMDGDSLGDGYEVATTRQVPMPEAKAASNPHQADSDQDGLMDAMEGDCYFPSDWQPTLSIQPLPPEGLPVSYSGHAISHSFSLMPRTLAAAWGPYSWECLGMLPPGLALYPSEDGLMCWLSGTLETDFTGSDSFWIKVTDGYGNSDQIMVPFHVYESIRPPVELQIETESEMPSLLIPGESYSLQFHSTPETASSWSLSGDSVAGLSINNDGVLSVSGVLLAYIYPGTYNITLNAHLRGGTSSKTIPFTIPPFEILDLDQPLPAATLEMPYEAQLITNYSNQVVSWSLLSQLQKDYR